MFHKGIGITIEDEINILFDRFDFHFSFLSDKRKIVHREKEFMNLLCKQYTLVHS